MTTRSNVHIGLTVHDRQNHCRPFRRSCRVLPELFPKCVTNHFSVSVTGYHRPRRGPLGWPLVREFRWALLLLMLVSAVCVGASQSAERAKIDKVESYLLTAGDARLKSGVGIGQMTCGEFNESVRRLESGDDDGLYFAFIAWRDGFITAMTSVGWRPSFVSLRGEEWLRAFCESHPQERFAQAVVTFVRELKHARMARR